MPKRVYISMTDEQVRFLKIMSMVTDLRQSQLVRDFIDDAIAKNRHTLEEFLKNGGK